MWPTSSARDKSSKSLPPLPLGVAVAQELLAERVVGVRIAALHPGAVEAQRLGRGLGIGLARGGGGLVGGQGAEPVPGAGVAEIARPFELGAGGGEVAQRQPGAPELIVEAAVVAVGRHRRGARLAGRLRLDLVRVAGQADAFGIEVVAGLVVAGIGLQRQLHGVGCAPGGEAQGIGRCRRPGGGTGSRASA